MSIRRFKRSAKHSAKSAKQEIPSDLNFADLPSPVDNSRILSRLKDLNNKQDTSLNINDFQKQLSTSFNTMKRVNNKTPYKLTCLSNKFKEEENSGSISGFNLSLKKRIDSSEQ